MKKSDKYILLLLLLSFHLCIAQTVNDGKLFVSPNTLMSVQSNFDNRVAGAFENNGEVVFKGNFNNDGITTFNPSFDGNTRFEGFNPQEIKGSIPADFNNVAFKNNSPQPAFRLYADISINSNADFSKGIIDADNYGGVIFFGNNSTHTNESNDSYVNGKVIKNGASDFTFPVGDQDHYRFFKISTEGAEVSSFSGQYFFENSNTLHAHSSKDTSIELIDDKEYWVVEKGTGSQDVLITLSWDNGDTSPVNITSLPEKIHVVRWDTVKNLWVDEGGSVDVGQKIVTTIAKLNGYGIFTLAIAKGTLSEGNIIVYNAISPNGDGVNDYFVIDGIKNYLKNKVSIFNRWGMKVFETTAYDTKNNVFDGVSQNNATLASHKKLPSGTYFYIIEYDYEVEGNTTRKISKTGYLYLSE